MQTVIIDETVKIIGGNNHRPGHQNTDILPSVKEVMFLQNMVQERESARLSSHRTVAAAGEIDRTIIGLRVIFGNHAQRLVDTVVVNETDIRLADVLYVRVVLNGQFVYLMTDGEQSAGKEPFREVVIITQTSESSR